MGMTERDLELAQAISQVAGEQDLQADPAQVQSLLVIPGAPTSRRSRLSGGRRWATSRARIPRKKTSLIRTTAARVLVRDDGAAARRRPGAIHIAVWLAAEEAEKRVDAALAAGGHLVRDDFAPAWWTLADAYGNEIDIATISHRD